MRYKIANHETLPLKQCLSTSVHRSYRPYNFSTTCLFLLIIPFQVLLMLQFIWGLNLTQEELPDENPPFLRQLGLEKPREYPAFVSLLGNSIFTAMFWVTLKQHIREQIERKRDVLVEGVGAHPFHVAFTTAYSDVEKPGKRFILCMIGPSPAG